MHSRAIGASPSAIEVTYCPSLLTSWRALNLLQQIETGPISLPTRGKTPHVAAPYLDASNDRSPCDSAQPLSRLDHERRVQGSGLPEVVRGSSRHRQSELEAVHSSIAHLQPAPFHVQLCDHGDSAVDAAQ